MQNNEPTVDSASGQHIMYPVGGKLADGSRWLGIIENPRGSKAMGVEINLPCTADPSKLAKSRVPIARTITSLNCTAKANSRMIMMLHV